MTSIDYAKAFNRMSFQGCLTNRTMTVKVGNTMSIPRPVHGGCPQGSILGVFPFNATINDLQEGCTDLEGGDEAPAVTTSNSSEEDSGLDRPTPLLSTLALRGTEDPVLHDSPILGPTKYKKMMQKKKPRRMNISSEMDETIPHERNAVTEAKWKHELAVLLRFINDGFTLAKLNFENSFGFEVNGVFFRTKQALQSQNMFRHLVRRVEDIGMVVNANKTAMVCVSGAMNYRVSILRCP